MGSESPAIGLQRVQGSFYCSTVLCRPVAGDCTASCREPGSPGPEPCRCVGVDVLHIEGPRSVEEVKQIRAEVEGPLTANFYNLAEELTPEQAQEIGLCESRYPGMLSSAMHTAGWDLLQRFQRDGYQGVRDYYEEYSINVGYGGA